MYSQFIVFTAKLLGRMILLVTDGQGRLQDKIMQLVIGRDGT